uniref:F-box domain-containing protein n=1 Tax=Parastrongyloides trichosuri TaxID=131310 RepID=A0A0N4Z2G7_PARTI
MAQRNINIPDFVKRTDSINEFITTALSSDEVYELMKQNRIIKSFRSYDCSYSLSIDKSKDMELKCFSTDGGEHPIAYIKNEIRNRRKLDLEVITNVNIKNSTNFKNFTSQEMIKASKVYAEFISYILSNITFATSLNFRTTSFMEDDDCFYLLILANLQSVKLEQVNSITLWSVIDFLTKYNFMEYDIFDSKPNLTTFTISTVSTTLDQKIPMLRDELWRFIDYMNKKHITLNLVYESTEVSIFLTTTILQYCRKNNIEVQVNQEINRVEFFDRIKKGISRKDFELMPHLSSVTLFIDEFEHFSYIKDVLKKMNNLESFKIVFSSHIYTTPSEKPYKLEEIRKIYEKNFNYQPSINKLKEFLLEYDDDHFPNYFDTFRLEDQLYDLFFKYLSSVLPKTIEVLSFKKLPCLKDEYFNNLYKSIPNIETITLKNCKYVPDEALLLFRKLKNVILSESTAIMIPSWVGIVIYCDFNNHSSRYYYRTHRRKTETHFYRLMRNGNLLNAFWCDEGKKSDYVIFLKDILQWKTAINLLNF